MDKKSFVKKIIKNKNFKHGIAYTVYSFINNGISFILVLILAKFLTPYEYGELNLFNTFITLFSIIIVLSSTSYISINYYTCSLTKIQNIIQTVFSISTIMLLFSLIIFTLLSTPIQSIIGIDIEYLFLGIFICYFNVYNNVNLEIWRLEEKPTAYGSYSFSFALCNFLITLLFVVTFCFGWKGRVYAWFLVGFIYFIVSFIFLIKRKYLKISPTPLKIVKQTLLYSVPLVPHALSYWLKQGSDRFIINYFWDSTEVGLFSFAMNFASIINIIGTAFNSTNSVYLYKNLSQGYNKCKKQIEKNTKYMYFVFFVITLTIITITLIFIPIILPQYSLCIRYIPPLCIGAFFQCLYLLWVNYLFFYKKTRQLMVVTVTTCIIQICSSILITRFDVIYTAYISMAISAVTMFAVMTLSKRTLSHESKK